VECTVVLPTSPHCAVSPSNRATQTWPMVCNPLLSFCNKSAARKPRSNRTFTSPRHIHQKPALADHGLTVRSGQGRFTSAIIICAVIIATDARDHRNSKRRSTPCPDDNHRARPHPNFRNRLRAGPHTLSNHYSNKMKCHMRISSLPSPPVDLLGA